MNNVLDPKGLEANRAGRLTFLQGLGLFPWMLFGALLFLPGVFMIAAIIYNFITKPIDGNFMLGAIFNLVGGGAFIWFGYLLGGKLLLDLLTGKVSQADGPGMKYSGVGGGRDSGRVYYYSVGELNFQIPSYSTYKKLKDANSVHAYYLPRSRTLVNIEFPFSITSPTSYGKSKANEQSKLSGFQKLEEAEKKIKQEK